MIKYVAAFVALCGSFSPVGPISNVDNLEDWYDVVALYEDIMDEVDAGDNTRYMILDDTLFSTIGSDDWPVEIDQEVTINPGDALIFELVSASEFEILETSIVQGTVPVVF